MKKIFYTLSLLLLVEANLFSQQHSDCPGVPGACGFPSTTSAHTINGNHSPQTGNGTLGNVYYNTKCGLNYMAITQRLGQRFTPVGVAQPAPYVISGLQTCDTIEKALLYVEGSGTGAAQTVTITPPVGPAQNFALNIAGQGPDKCWGYAGSFTYSADITSVISGNGTYNLSNVFTDPPNIGEDMDGATIILIYSNRTATWAGTLSIDDGAVVINGGTANYDMSIPAVCGATTNASAFCCVGDIQAPVNSLTLNGTNAPFTWDWWNFVQVNTTVTAAQTLSNFNLATAGDCFNLCVVGLYYQTTTCTTCPSGSALVSLAATSTIASCSACDGSATIIPTPAGSYTYSWSPSGGTNATATNLCSGTYTVTVGGGCVASTQTVSVGNSANLSSTANITNVSCFNSNNGSVTITPSGGTGPYTYSWLPSGGSGATASGLSAGTYTCTVTDANGCTYNQVCVITQPPSMVMNINSTSPLCNGQSNGTAIATTVGGSPTYNYVWTPVGGNNDTATGLAGGSYTVTVTDANSCTATQTFTLIEPAPITNTFSIINIGCAATGSATSSPTGGTSPYTYLWSSGGTSATELNLTVGTYTLLITDANGCTLVDTATITAVSGMTVTPSQTNITCFGMNNGTATAVPNGGNPPYTYSWSPFGGTGSSATNLFAGTYTVTITDSNGCTAIQVFAIIEPPALTSSMNILSVSCFGSNDGSATMTVNGGSPPLTYNWSPSGGPGQTSNNLSAGSYTVVATDSSGCATNQTFTLTQPLQLNVAMTSGSLCPGGTTTISAAGSGGTSPYVYQWSNSVTGPSQIVSTNVTTSYTVTITDANGCTTTGISTVTLNPVPTSSFSTNAINGVFSVGSGALCMTDASTNATQWYWNFNGQDSSTVQNPCITLGIADVGTYCVTLITQNSFGCLDTANTCLEITNVSYSIPNVFTPNADNNNEYFTITNTGMKSVRCEIYNRWGELIYEWDSPTGYWDGRTNSGKEAVDGVYYYTAHLVDLSDKIYEEAGFVHLIK